MTGNIHTLRNSAGGNGSDNGPLQVLFGIPIVTRYLISSAVVMTLLIRLRIVNTAALLFQFRSTVMRLQIWRPFTSCLILPFEALPAMLELYTIYSSSSQLESRRNSLDYLFYLVFCVIVMALMLTMITGASSPMVLTSGLVSCLTYTWSLDNANIKVLFYGLFPVWGKYFPLLQLFMAFVFGNRDYVICLIGFLTGYLYACLDTRTLGPFYGWLTRSQQENYGIYPNGNFGAPRFISTLLGRSNDLRSSASSVKATGGRKLGFRDSSETRNSGFTTSSLSSSSSSQRRASNDTTQRSAFFPGSGQRLGS